MKVKICGITREEDASAAVRAGADALGFIFVPSSKRWIEPVKARDIIAALPRHVTSVGVFGNASREEVHRVIETTGISLLQFHGEELPEEIAGYPLPVWKAFRVGPDFDIRSLMAYDAEAYLLDAYVKGEHGGTGQRFDWDVAVEAKKYGPIILSGGITPDNVRSAVRKVAPYALDISSGVESSPGIKDPLKLTRLFDALRQTKESLC